MSASRRSLGSDFSKVDVYENTDADYAELPEVTDQDFARATVHHGGRPLRGRPPLGSGTKQLVSLRLDPEIQARFRSSGPGWQARMNDFLRHNEVVLKMIVEFDAFIADMDGLIGQLRAGELTTVFETVEASVARVERNIRNTRETVRSLREQLVWQPVEPVG